MEPLNCTPGALVVARGGAWRNRGAHLLVCDHLPMGTHGCLSGAWVQDVSTLPSGPRSKRPP